MGNEVALLRAELYSPAARDRFEVALVDNRLKFEAEAGFAMQALQNNDYLARIAAGNMESFRNAVTNVAAIGVSLNPAKKQAYLVPRDGKVCLDISYMGMLDLAIETGAIQWGQAKIVKANDHFELRGIDQPPDHSYNPFSTERGETIGVYVVVKTAAGDYLTHAMPISAVNEIRDRSPAWKAWIKDKKKCPWVTDKEEMDKKTCVKQGSKYWPKNGNSRLEAAIHHMNTDGGEGLDARDMGRAEVVTPAFDLTAALGEVDKINDLETLRAKWQQWNAECVAAKDVPSWKAVMAALNVRAGELQQQPGDEA